MKILILTDNFPPEVNAPATRTMEHSLEWIKKGAEINVITSVPNFPKGIVFEGYKNTRNQKEILKGVSVYRVWTFISANQGVIKRTMDYLSFGISSLYRSLFVPCDLVFATSPQFFTAIGGYLASKFKGKPWVLEVRDLWPESIAAVGAISQQSWIYKILKKLEVLLYREASAIVVVTNSFKRYMTDLGIDENKISVVTNGVDLNVFVPKTKDNDLLKDLGLNGKFVIGYLGTHGMAHGLHFVLRALKNLDDPDIHFIFIGDGAEKENLVDFQKELDLNNVTFLPSIKKKEINRYISIMDAALVNLKKSETFKSVIPSKIFENAAMLKPILLGVEGEAKEIIENYQAGLCYEPENATEFLTQIKRIKTDKLLYKSLQEGCQLLAENYNRTVLADKMYQIFLSVTTESNLN